MQRLGPTHRRQYERANDLYTPVCRWESSLAKYVKSIAVLAKKTGGLADDTQGNDGRNESLNVAGPVIET